MSAGLPLLLALLLAWAGGPSAAPAPAVTSSHNVDVAGNARVSTTSKGTASQSSSTQITRLPIGQERKVREVLDEGKVYHPASSVTGKKQQTPHGQKKQTVKVTKSKQKRKYSPTSQRPHHPPRSRAPSHQQPPPVKSRSTRGISMEPSRSHESQGRTPSISRVRAVKVSGGGEVSTASGDAVFQSSSTKRIPIARAASGAHSPASGAAGQESAGRYQTTKSHATKPAYHLPPSLVGINSPHPIPEAGDHAAPATTAPSYRPKPKSGLAEAPQTKTSALEQGGTAITQPMVTSSRSTTLSPNHRGKPHKMPVYKSASVSAPRPVPEPAFQSVPVTDAPKTNGGSPSFREVMRRADEHAVQVNKTITAIQHGRIAGKMPPGLSKLDQSRTTPMMTHARQLKSGTSTRQGTYAPTTSTKTTPTKKAYYTKPKPIPSPKTMSAPYHPNTAAGTVYQTTPAPERGHIGKPIPVPTPRQVVHSKPAPKHKESSVRRVSEDMSGVTNDDNGLEQRYQTAKREIERTHKTFACSGSFCDS